MSKPKTEIYIPENRTPEDFLAAAAKNISLISESMSESDENYFLLRAAYTQIHMVREAFLSKTENKKESE